MVMQKFKAISLFSGGMGLDLGVEMSGRIEILACVEKEPFFCETIRINRDAGRLRRDLKIYEADVCDLDPARVLADLRLNPGELDLLIGGPPCQSFSTAGRRGTIQDPRGTLLWQFLRFIQEMKPRFFLMENVRGLLSAAIRHRPIAERPEKGGPPLSAEEKPGSVVRQFSDDLQKIEPARYHMDCFEVNAVNYGAPQIRERAIFIGNRYNTVVDFPSPTHGAPNGNNQMSFLGEEDSCVKPWRTLRDAIGGLKEKEPLVMDFSPRKKKYLMLIPPGSNWRSLPEDIQKESMGRAWYAKGGRSGWWRRLTFDLPCPTLVTMPNHAGTSLCHPTQTRALTVGEYAMIQEFPPDWVFAGTLSNQYTQVGNAVPVRLGRVAGNLIADSLDLLKKREWRPCSTVPENYRIIYIQSHIRTRKWYRAGKTFVWKDGESNGAASYAAPVTKRKSRSI